MTRKTRKELEHDIADALAHPGYAARTEPETKKERATRLMAALRAARSLEFEARKTRDYLNPDHDGAQIMALSEKAVRAAEELLSAIAALKGE